MRVRVSARGYGILSCGKTRVLVRGETDVTFTVLAVGSAVTVVLRSFRGAVRMTVSVPAGGLLDCVPAATVSAPSPLLKLGVFRPTLTHGLLGPALGTISALSVRPSFRDLAPRVHRARLRYLRNLESPT